ncbi:hypothetical protein GN956_G20580 [Arapaima gigas]
MLLHKYGRLIRSANPPFNEPNKKQGNKDGVKEEFLPTYSRVSLAEPDRGGQEEGRRSKESWTMPDEEGSTQSARSGPQPAQHRTAPSHTPTPSHSSGSVIGLSSQSDAPRVRPRHCDLTNLVTSVSALEEKHMHGTVPSVKINYQTW